MRAKFSELKYEGATQQSCCAKKGCGEVEPWLTAERIPVKGAYTAEDLEGMEHLNYAAGIAPFLRGPYSTMYVMRPWTIRQYAGFSTAEESNAFYRRNLAAGQKGLSVAFDLATHRGYDADHPRVVGDVGKAGVSICSVEDMKVLFNGIPLDRMSVSMTMNGAVLPVLAFYIVTGLEQGCSLEQLSGTIQNDILKEFMVRNTYIYPPEFSMRIIADIFEYTSKNMPKFNSISISGYHMQEAGATADIEPGLHAGRRSGVPPRGHQRRHVDRRLRAASVVLLGHRHESLHGDRQDARRTYALGQDRQAVRPEEPPSRWRCAPTRRPRAGRLPSRIRSTTWPARPSRRWAPHWDTPSRCTPTRWTRRSPCRPTSRPVSPATRRFTSRRRPTSAVRSTRGQVPTTWRRSRTKSRTRPGSTSRRSRRLGGMAKAIETGIPKMRIEEAAARKQARIDSGAEKIIGVNEYRLEKEAPIDILAVDNTAVRESQIKRLEGAARFARRNRREEGAGGHHRVREDQAGQSARAWPSRRRRSVPRWAKSPMPARSS